MTENTEISYRVAELEPSKHDDSVHSRLIADVTPPGGLLDALRHAAPLEQYHAKAEWNNGHASQNLTEIEKWVSDSKTCGLINQDQLETKMENFAKKTDDMWHKMNGVDTAKDEYLTYPRFTDMIELLDDSHRDQLLQKLPWTLKPGE